MNDRIVWAVECFMEEQWIEPSANWPSWWFDKNAYSRAAVEELIELLKVRGSKPASRVTGDFVRKMDRYSCRREDTRRMFSIAREAASDIDDIVRAME